METGGVLSYRKDVNMGGLSTLGVLIDGKYYRVMPFPYSEVEKEGPDILRKGIAYQIQTDLTHGLFPYRGTLGPKEHLDYRTAQVGIYMKQLKGGEYVMRIVRPRTKKEREEYALGREMDIMAATVSGKIPKDQLIDLKMVPTGGTGDAFMPPIRAADDPLNRLMKLAIRLKEMPFGPYGKRLEALAVDRSGIEGVNTKNNARRALYENTAMSPSKFIVYADTWEYEAAIILRDSPESTHPMFEDGKMLILYPSGPAFTIDPDKLVDARDMILEAIQESTTTDDRKRKKRKTDNEEEK